MKIIYKYIFAEHFAPHTIFLSQYVQLVTFFIKFVYLFVIKKTFNNTVWQPRPTSASARHLSWNRQRSVQSYYGEPNIFRTFRAYFSENLREIFLKKYSYFSSCQRWASRLVARVFCALAWIGCSRLCSRLSIALWTSNFTMLFVAHCCSVV